MPGNEVRQLFDLEWLIQEIEGAFIKAEAGQVIIISPKLQDVILTDAGRWALVRERAHAQGVQLIVGDTLNSIPVGPRWNGTLHPLRKG